MDRINALLEARGANKNNDEIRRIAQNTINEVVSAIFADLPNVNIIGAQGYTPYFNDGDVCEWGLYTGVDWLNIDNLYYSPIGEDDDNPEYNALLSRDISNVDWKEREALSEYPNLRAAVQLLDTLSDEFKIVDGQNNGTWWLFIRDVDEENGFRIESGTFEHD